jgi:prepilin-type N-terminal cleavage/methylation domain-containing protein
MTPRQSVTPPRAKFIYINGLAMICHAFEKMSPQRAGLCYLSHRERSPRRSVSEGGRVRASLTAPSPHPASAARLLTSSEGRGNATGFSLVELSIVLVILGLLVGGILAGQSLIRAAELRSVTVDYNRFVAATQTFRDKYFALPGDMPNATAFWGSANATPATCRTTVSTTTATCDGNGDGAITTVDSWTTVHEIHSYWKHLANAGLIEGNYTGTQGSSGATNTWYVIAGVNAPKSKLSNSGWSVFYWPNYPGDAFSYAIDYQNLLIVGAPNGNTLTNVPNLKPEEAWNIDSKIDDGKPAMGKVIGNSPGACSDNASPTTLTANYALSSSSIACVLYFSRAF